MEKIFTLEHEMLAVKNLAGLYDAIAEKLGFDILDESLRYDCRKICISKEMQQMLYESYEAMYPEQFQRDRRGAKLSVTMLLATSGPKVNQELDADMVEIEEGFLSYVEKEEQEEETA